MIVECTTEVSCFDKFYISQVGIFNPPWMDTSTVYLGSFTISFWYNTLQTLKEDVHHEELTINRRHENDVIFRNNIFMVNVR